MPNGDQLFDLEKLRKDPELWKRLSAPVDDSGTLGNIFRGKENPFEKNGEVAMQQVRDLASQGKLYVREFGRSRHFRKVEQDGDNLKLDNVSEHGFQSRANGPVFGVLLRLSRAYFKWIGIDFISNWIDKRMKIRDATIERDKQYKAEYKSLSSDQKKELKDLRKQEKQEKKTQKRLEKAERKEQKRLEKAQKRMEKAQKRWEKAQKEAKEAQKKLDQLRGKNSPKTKGEMKSPLSQPPETEAEKTTIQPTLLGDQLQKQEEQLTTEQQKTEQTKGKEQPTEQPKDKEQPTEQLNVQPPNVDQQMGENAPETEIKAPLEQPPEVEPNRVNMDNQANEQSRKTLEEQLATEKQEMEAAGNWKDLVVNALFSHEEGRANRETYQGLNNSNEAAGTEYLSGAVFGILTGKTESPAQKQQVMDALLSGKPLGSENDSLIKNGIAAYNDAIARKTDRNGAPLADMLADSIRELSQQASRENKLSARHVMIGKMISTAVKFAAENQLELPLNADEWRCARGASQLGKLAQTYHDARQYLGKEPMDLTSSQGRKAVRNLQIGNAVEKMIQEDIKTGGPITGIQYLMGQGIMTVKSLKALSGGTETRKNVTAEQVQTLLKNPDGYDSFVMGRRFAVELLDGTREAMKGVDLTKQKQLEGPELELPELNQMNVPG